MAILTTKRGAIPPCGLVPTPRNNLLADLGAPPRVDLPATPARGSYLWGLPRTPQRLAHLPGRNLGRGVAAEFPRARNHHLSTRAPLSNRQFLAVMGASKGGDPLLSWKSAQLGFFL